MVRCCFYLFSLLLLIPTTSSCDADDPLSPHLQMLVVTSLGWEETQGTLQCFERKQGHEAWSAVGTLKQVCLGRSGMAWGIGLYPLSDQLSSDHTSLAKVEGDLKSPAGIFSLGSAFGFAPYSAMTHLKVDYLELNACIEAVDDPQSQCYNCLVDTREVTVDWKSAEKMHADPHYAIGLVVHHNFPHIEPGKGSAIFLHKWYHDREGTSGCTSMSQEHLEEILCWLDKDKNPVLVQLPDRVYVSAANDWHLPLLTLAE